MRSSSSIGLAALAAFLSASVAWSSRAEAQPQAQGYALDRLYLAAPGAGWFVMDALDIHGGLGGVASMTLGYSNDPLLVTQGPQRLAVVANQAFADFGFAATYSRWRFYLDLPMPVVIKGHSGVLDGYSFTAPNVDLSSVPDTISDPRIGVDVRILGEPGGPFRLGASGQLFVPSGVRGDYDTDERVRAMIRALFAGDIGQFTWAAQLGFHIRTLDEAPTPDSPRGSELLFGAAGGVRVPVAAGALALVMGPEFYGATPFSTFFSASETPFEGLLSARVEGTRSNGVQWRFRVGAGGGINAVVGAPAWRVVAGIEVFNHSDKQ
jgi:hypothetical protein